jgi:hypothetical protein
MKLATATLSAAAFLALAAPVFAEATGSSTYWENMRRHSSGKERPPYALTGNARRMSDEGLRAHTAWIGGGRDRRTVYELE